MTFMRRTQQSSEHKGELFTYLLFLTVFFILIEISLFIQSSEIYLGDFKLIADRLTIPAKVLPGIIYFLFVQLLIHFIYTLVIWAWAWFLGTALNCTWKKTEFIGFSLWFLGILWILFANQWSFPNSKFAHLVSFLIPVAIGKVFLIALSILFLILFFISLKGLFVICAKRWILLGIIILSTLGLVSYSTKSSVITNGATTEQPNVILIGIDALRPDFLGFFGYKKQTPHIDNFLEQSIVFSDALTPIARTFPAWVSILTGQYPKKSGVRFNLPDLISFNWQTTLPAILRSKGYETIFATDETRFSNIDQRFGFDKTITPPIGFNDFLLGNLNDFPLSNLLINSWVGTYLFPYSSGNRPVYTTYDPNRFLSLLEPTLKQSRSKPLFLAIHFCLPHYPYLWGHEAADDKSVHNYQAAIKRVDQQFYDFMNLLKQSKLLDHSIVVLLSDHGEAIELPGDRATEKDLFIPGVNNAKGVIPRFYPKSFDFETVNQSAGHGTDILGLTQYHIVFAWRGFGLSDVKKGLTLSKLTSLLDIKPTILDYLNISSDNLDGHSLKNALLQKSSPIMAQHFFMETDFSPQAIRSVHPETRKLLFEGIEYYQVNPLTSRITVKKNMEHLIISSKQYADVYGEWILALYPQNKFEMMPILLNLNTGYWTNDLRTSFAENSPAKEMLKSLQNFYGDEITKIM